MQIKVPYFEEVQEGDEPPPVSISNITRTHIVKYAGASGDFNPIHHDELYAIRAGYDRVFAMGMLSAGFLSHMVTDWLGDSNLRKFKVRFSALVWPGDTITCRGKISKKFSEDGKNYIQADIYAENQKGEKVVIGVMLAELPSKKL
jgi:acyl dehydratase